MVGHVQPEVCRLVELDLDKGPSVRKITEERLWAPVGLSHPFFLQLPP